MFPVSWGRVRHVSLVDSSLFHCRLAELASNVRKGGDLRFAKWLHGLTLEDTRRQCCSIMLANEELQDAMARMCFDIIYPGYS